MATVTVAVLATLAIGTSSATAAKLITGKHIKNGSIGLADISKSAKKGLKGPRGPQGPPGARGPAGTNASGVTTTIIEVTGFTAAGAVGSAVTARCPAGHRVVGGGSFSDSGFAYIDKTYDGTSWSVAIDNTDSLVGADIDVTAVCARGAAVAVVTRRTATASREADVAKRRAVRR